jgi:hypothetical protein
MEMLRKSIESSKVASETCPASARTVSVLEKTLSEAKCKSFYHDVQRKRPFRQFFDTITLPPGETLPQLEAYTALRNAEDKTYQVCTL